MVRQLISKKGIMVMLGLFLAMTGLTCAFLPPVVFGGDLGLCLPSPDRWHLHYPSSWLINTGVLLMCVAALVFTNRQFNFLQSTDNLLPAAFLILLACNPLVTKSVCTSTLLLAVNMTCLRILFDTYRKPNASQDYFLIASLLALGSMVEYAFIPMMVAFVAAGFWMKSFGIREAVAFLLGIVAPFWTGIGIGLIPISDFRIPQFSTLFDSFSPNSDLFVVVVSLGFTIITAILLSLSNSLRLYSGNSKVRAMNNAVNMMGYVCAICIAVDFTNMLAYAGTLYLWASLQLANMFSLNRQHVSRFWAWLLFLIYIGFYLWILFF